MVPVCLFSFILVTQLTTINTGGCDSFNNTMVAGWPQLFKTDHEDFVVNGCLEPGKFGKVILLVKINGKISRLGKDSIRNMPELKTVRIIRNDLEILEPRAFRNLSSLRILEIAKNNLQEIPNDVFILIPNITDLLLYRNKINFIASGAFANLESLETISLSFNALTHWNRKWFENCTNLKYIDFKNNKISMIQRRAFSALPRLTFISLDGNEINTIEPGAFQNLKKLSFLSLARNRLTVIDERAFPNNIHIHRLHIHLNYLNYLSDNLLEKISVSYIFLDFNPWKYTCLQKINEWLDLTNTSLDNNNYFPRCKSSSALIFAVPQDDLKKCQESVDEDLTRRYIGVLKNVSEPLEEYCTTLELFDRPWE